MNFKNKVKLNKHTPASEHSAINTCGISTGCGRCFNNIIDNRGFVLMLTPKVATQSTIAAYRQSGAVMINWMSKEIAQSYNGKFTIIGWIRNPFDRLASCWQWWCVDHPKHRTWPVYGIPDNCSFERFVDIVTEVPHDEADKHWRACSYDLLNDGRLIPDHLVRFESMMESFNVARELIKSNTGVQLGELPHRNKSHKRHYSTYYTPSMVEKVGDYYEKDLNYFGYRFEQCH